MLSDNCTWISTDRTTEAEVLNELAAADTPAVIVTRDEPDERMLRRVAEMKLPAQSAIFLETHPESTVRKYLGPGWLQGFIESPWQYSRITDISLKPRERLAPPFPSTLRDWLIQRGRSPSDPAFTTFTEHRTDHVRTLGEPTRPALVAGPSKVTDLFREQIDEFTKSNVGYGNFDTIALRAGVYLWHDLMDESHELAQSIEGKGWNLNGDYVHAILHRREPDYGNAKYWFRRVGRHPNFDRLGQEAGPLVDQFAADWKPPLLKSGWDPFAFVDFCEQAVATKNPRWLECAETIQEVEMLLLLQCASQER